MSTQLVAPIENYAPGQYIIRKRQILSVFPLPCEQQLRTGPIGTRVGFTTYTLPAAPKKGYSVIDVEDGQEFLMNWETKDLTPVPKSCDILAADLVRMWTSGTMGASRGGHPAIMVVPEEVKGLRPGVYDEAPKDPACLKLYESLWAFQEKSFQDLVDEGTTMFNKQEQRNITDLHREAARWLGYTVPWITEHRLLNAQKTCPACAKEIMAAALVCEFCHENLPNFYESMGLTVDAEKDPVVATFLETRMKKRNPVVQTPVTPPINPNQPKR